MRAVRRAEPRADERCHLLHHPRVRAVSRDVDVLEAVEAVGFEVSWICLVLAVFELLSVKIQ